MSLDLNPTCPALILKASRDAIHHGDLGVARTLGRLGVPVYAVVADRCTPLAASRYLKGAFVWNKWPQDKASFVAAMSAIGQSVGRRLVLIPTDDLSAICAAENAADLDPWFLLPHVRPELPCRLADKIQFHDLCLKIGIPVPRVSVPHGMDDVFAVADSWNFPVVVKAADQWALLRGRFSTKVVRSSTELISLYKRLEDVENPRSMIQEYIEGEDWIAHGYYNSEKGIRLTFTGRKLLSDPAMAGSTAVGVSIPNETLRCRTENLMDAVGYSGIVDIDWRRDKLDGQYKVVDCNPRIGQNFRMFENGEGIDVVRAQYLDLTGSEIEHAPMIAGRLFRVESFCFLAFLRGSYRGASTQDVCSSSGRARAELAWWKSDDLLPFFIMIVRMPASLLRRALLRAVKGLLSWQKLSLRGACMPQAND